MSFHLACKALGRFERRDVVSRNRNRGILRDVAGHFLGAALYDERTETAQVNVLVGRERILDGFHERFHDLLHLGFLHACAFRNFVNNIRLCHD